MSEQAIEFLEEWISEKVQRRSRHQAPLEKQAEILCLKCQADAAKAGVPLDEIVEEVGDLEDLIAAKLEDAAGRPMHSLRLPNSRKPMPILSDSSTHRVAGRSFGNHPACRPRQGTALTLLRFRAWATRSGGHSPR